MVDSPDKMIYDFYDFSLNKLWTTHKREAAHVTSL